MIKKKNRKKVRRLLKESETEATMTVEEVATEKQISKRPSLVDSFNYNLKKGITGI
jgi:hypothetical protein